MLGSGGVVLQWRCFGFSRWCGLQVLGSQAGVSGFGFFVPHALQAFRPSWSWVGLRPGDARLFGSWGLGSSRVLEFGSLQIPASDTAL